MTRAQAYTLEGVVAGLVLVSAVLFGLQAVDTAPYSGGTDRTSSDLLRQEARDALHIAAEQGALDRIVRCTDGSGAPNPRIGRLPDDNATRLGAVLGEAFRDIGYRYNVELRYWANESRSDPGRQTERVFDSGEPGSSAVSVSRRTTVYDDMPLLTGDHCRERTGDQVGATSSFYVPDADLDSELYNVVEVRLVVWRGS